MSPNSISTLHTPPLSPRAWYGASITDFLVTETNAILGALTAQSAFSVDPTQRDAWLMQIEFLKRSLKGLQGTIFFEFNIPRMGRRIDVVLLIGPAIFVVEFKVGESRFDRAAIDQVWDYALDLKNFHEGSHRTSVLPILIATASEETTSGPLNVDIDDVFQPIRTNPIGFREVIDLGLSIIVGNDVNEVAWARSSYKPTPTIIEAARSLYAQHSVESIARSDADAQNLGTTSSRVEEIIEHARLNRQKVICFVTGVPGAGKTLVGLNVATQRGSQDDPTHAVFLSGNGPLVDVLREALTRDEVHRRRLSGERVRKGSVFESVKAFIQNVHHFRDDALEDIGPPSEHVVIFDEAQRAWDLQQTANFMRRKKGRTGFSQSEAEFLISCMDRRPDWAVIVCLVGGGQEINTGEAGIDAWLDAIVKSFPHWRMHISSRLTDSEYASGHAMQLIRDRPNTTFDDSLHLSVSMRSFRSENVSMFVKCLLDCDKRQARNALRSMEGRYPLAVTRDLKTAKEWVRAHARGSERFGMLASSKAQRLKPYAIDIRFNVDPVHWFLNGKDDIRSSYYLEDVATEFQVQGLELDWACVSWDGDLRFDGSGWSSHDFRGSQWTNINSIHNRKYLRNAYRVLLTRARQGMIIFVPRGDPEDPTRAPSYYDSTFGYLSELGIPQI